MSLHIDRRADGGLALYIDGDLQLDTSDEAVYHESLVLPALCLLRNRRRSHGKGVDGLRVLICGGGDGLALREALRFPGVAHVDLVDYDPEVVTLGREQLASRNASAFDDARVGVYISDAWEFVQNAERYDVIVCDLTVPRRPEDSRVFSREWYERLKSRLADDGLLAINGFSPQRTPEAFWCLHKTVRAAGLSVLPYRVCIPSFRAQGYGVWAFLLAGNQPLHPLRQADLRNLACPVPTAQADLNRLWRGASFSREERGTLQRVPIHTLDSPVLLPMLLNPGSSRYGANAVLPTPLSTADEMDGEPVYDIDSLLDAVPVLHPYHTRDMVEALAEQVAGSVRGIDIRRLVQALLRRAAELPRDLFAELTRLRDYLRDHAPDFREMRAWGFKLFAALVIVMTVANAIAPDNAFGKGSSGIGHASFSRGFSASPSGVRGGFAGGRGGGSFGSAHTSGSTGATVSGARVTGSGFRSGYGHGYASDIYGYSYRPRIFIYGGYSHTYYVGHGGPRGSGGHIHEQRDEHKTLFVADDDLMVLDNGDVVITISDTAYLLANGGKLELYSVNSLDPLLPVYAEPTLFNTIAQEITGQQVAVRSEVSTRRDWLSWVGWTSALFPAVREDWTEIRNLEDLDRKLGQAVVSARQPQALTPTIAPAGSVELFVGAYLLPAGAVALHGPNDDWLYTDGKQLWSGTGIEKKNARPCPPELAAVFKSSLTKLQKELGADILSLDNDLRQLQTDRASLNKDLQDYNTLSSSYGSSYEVDYGTDSMSASQAISKTEGDITQNQQDVDENALDRAKSVKDLAQINLLLPGFGK